MLHDQMTTDFVDIPVEMINVNTELEREVGLFEGHFLRCSHEYLIKNDNRIFTEFGKRVYKFRVTF